jgi:hypothetical protein
MTHLSKINSGRPFIAGTLPPSRRFALDTLEKSVAHSAKIVLKLPSSILRRVETSNHNGKIGIFPTSPEQLAEQDIIFVPNIHPHGAHLWYEPHEHLRSFGARTPVLFK